MIEIYQKKLFLTFRSKTIYFSKLIVKQGNLRRTKSWKLTSSVFKFFHKGKVIPLGWKDRYVNQINCHRVHIKSHMNVINYVWNDKAGFNRKKWFFSKMAPNILISKQILY